ncbi:MAG: methyltransferase [Verrucomicrobiales bacterium]|nr:methyltransferase [Verrucomicrobiales bacterium]
MDACRLEARTTMGMDVMGRGDDGAAEGGSGGVEVGGDGLAERGERGDGYELVQLANGTWSVHARRERETFHPVVGPAAEAEALYVRGLRLVARMAAKHGEFVLWDVGLGAAGNVLTVLEATQELSGSLRVVSFDRTLEPLRFALGEERRLGYLARAVGWVRVLLDRGRAEFRNGRQAVVWEVREGDFPTLLAGGAAGSLPAPDAIMYDAYSPATNPEMWTLPLFRRLQGRLDPGRPCALTTYSRSTLLRVTWLLAGLFVGVGGATGEKEETTIGANCRELIERPLDRRWLGRVRRSTSAEPLGEARYRQARLSAMHWEQLERHPQFAG